MSVTIVIHNPEYLLVVAERYKAVIEFERQRAAGKSVHSAASEAGFPFANLLRWQRSLHSGGVAALLPQYHKCGRKPKTS